MQADVARVTAMEQKRHSPEGYDDPFGGEVLPGFDETATLTGASPNVRDDPLRTGR